MANDLTTTLEDAGDFYIHYNKINIGNRNNGNKNLTRSFFDQKKIIATQVKKQYSKYFIANISNNTVQRFGEILDLTDEDFLTKLNNHLTKKLQNQLSVDKLSKLHSIVKDGNINSFLKQAVKNDSVNDLSKAFDIISQALNLLDKDNGGLGAVLLQSTKSANSLKQVGVNLSRLLEQYENKISKDYRLIRKQSLEAAVNQLRNLSSALYNGSFVSSGNKLSAEGLSTLLLNGLISTQIAQGLAFITSGKAGNLLYKSIVQAVGTKAVQVKSNYNKEIKITGKTDIKAKGVNVSLNGFDNGQIGGGITMNIGISSKFYTGQSFNTNLQKPVGVYGSGSGGTLKQALCAIWDNPSDRYLVYNFFTHEMYQPEFNDLIATRQILRLFATAGSESDFAQFMLVNGRIVSIWSIVQYVISSNLSLSASQDGGKTQGIVLSIPDRPKIYAANAYNRLDEPKQTKTMAAWTRSRKVNSQINNARIYAELHLKNLISSVGNIY